MIIFVKIFCLFGFCIFFTNIVFKIPFQSQFNQTLQISHIQFNIQLFIFCLIFSTSHPFFRSPFSFWLHCKKKILRTSLPTFTTLPCYHCPFDLIFIYHFWFVFCFLSTSGRVMRWSNSPPSCTEPLRRVQSLKFRSEEQSDLNDILLRVSAFGLFVYAVFSVIAGGMGAFTHEPNLLVMITGCLSVLQVRC